MQNQRFHLESAFIWLALMVRGGAEVYSAATTRDQARIVFDDAKRMIKLAPENSGAVIWQQ
ncbi:putative phage terminase, large subunit [Klebsiella pneumoniae]|uniref:Putative phage terminase, large subunit n=1 Tax=Klebsiella pneumoniae TaxID=573 RepID=A0A3S4GU47_KLEPN|nr:putative phage terminase, large subunit [Klebsiella pneumoniae]